MKHLVLIVGFLLSASAFAQVPPDCQFQVNPHSYSCTRWTFDGNQMFPLNFIDWGGVLQGSWEPLTFADPSGGNDDEQFSMLKNPNRPTIPEGVLDRATGAPLGNMAIQGGGAFFQNWHGLQFWSLANTLIIVDQFTARFQFQDQNATHTFNCRDFSRKNTHHLLCAWDTWAVPMQSWQHRGFIGFLKTAN